MQAADGTTIDRLHALITSRRGTDPATSYTAKLLAAGPPLIARKLGEEAIETLVAALTGKSAEVVAESADLLYHLLVLWSAVGVTPQQVWQALEAREGVSGLEEKARRPKS